VAQLARERTVMPLENKAPEPKKDSDAPAGIAVTGTIRGEHVFVFEDYPYEVPAHYECPNKKDVRIDHTDSGVTSISCVARVGSE
jgi:hypothetical protein